ncbi:hypothetical protein [Nonomuraea sp. SYSU D8015]|uniref:hypothetical protein n=1 Tax=Nonomuraea sp. SYSU D8015 TaxID=2593644 RepID=UPI0016613ACB|nr:hypothetical protein [Nonomuraea sp. SYSU D8015]
MGYQSDDLTPLLFPPAQGDFGFHQGKVLTWNQKTGQNTISMAGATLVDVPIMNGTEVPLLQPGHVVGMLRWKSSYFVLGRIIVPNAPDIGALPGALAGVGATNLNFEITTVREKVATAVFDVPPWANQALVLCVANASMHNLLGTSQFFYLTSPISDGFGGEMYANIPAGQTMHVSAATQFLMGEGAFDPVTGDPIGLGTKITVAAQVRASANVPSSTSNIASVHAIAMFRKA